MSNDFQTRAAAAAARISSLSPAEVIAQSLATDRPTIESAVKSFLSLTAARSLASHQTNTPPIETAISDTSKENPPKCQFSASDPRIPALKCARFVLTQLNQFELASSISPSTKLSAEDEKLEYEVVQRIWNGLLASEKKPCKFLGRSSLLHVYPLFLKHIQTSNRHIEDVPDDEAKLFLEEFGTLLERPTDRTPSDTDDDSALLWEKDRGAAELAHRRDRREKNKYVSSQESSKHQETDGPIIEEMKEE